MQISQHLIGAPAPDETDAIGIDIGTQEGHGAGGAKGARGHVSGHEVVGGAQDSNGQAKSGCEVGGTEAREPDGDGVEERGQGLCGWGVGGAQVKDPADGSSHWAKVRVATRHCDRGQRFHRGRCSSAW